MTINRTLVLASRPAGMVSADNFAIADLAMPVAAEGEILIRNRYASLDPGIRKTLGEDEAYWVPTPLGAPLPANVVGEVIESRHAGFAAGDLVTGTGRIQEFSAFAPGPMCWKLPAVSALPPSTALGVAGATGLTAYFGLLHTGRPQAGETVLISGAAGAVGSAAGQMAKIQGCRVVGIAGGEAKCARLVDEFGFDAAIDYRGKSLDELTAAIRAACPGGVDVHFENVGGRHLDAALANMNMYGRIAMCGLIAEYNLSQAPEPLHNLFAIIGKALRVEGFLCFTFAEHFPEAIARIAGWIAEGRLHFQEHIEDGLEAAAPLFVKLFDGSNEGKTIVRL